MSDVHDGLFDRVREFRAAGFEPSRIVIPGDDWGAVKDAAVVNEGEGWAGGDETLINGVRAVWAQTVSDPEIVFEEADNAE